MTRLQMRKTHKLGMAAVLGLEGYNRTHVPSRLNHLIEIRASQLNRCHYCIDMHTKAARKAGETEERIAALAGDIPDGLFDLQERAVLRLTDEVTRLGEDGVSDEAWDGAAAHFDDTQLGNLLLAIATINVWNRLGVATQLEP